MGDDNYGCRHASVSQESQKMTETHYCNSSLITCQTDLYVSLDRELNLLGMPRWIPDTPVGFEPKLV